MRLQVLVNMNAAVEYISSTECSEPGVLSPNTDCMECVALVNGVGVEQAANSSFLRVPLLNVRKTYRR